MHPNACKISVVFITFVKRGASLAGTSVTPMLLKLRIYTDIRKNTESFYANTSNKR